MGKLSEQKESTTSAAASRGVPRPTGNVYGTAGVVTCDMPQAWEIAQLYRAKKSVMPWGVHADTMTSRESFLDLLIRGKENTLRLLKKQLV